MRVLIDITHPAQVHFFKQIIWRLQRQGHAVMVTSRQKDIAVDLLDTLGIAHTCISKKASSLAGMAVELIARDLALWKLARRFKPDVMMARVGVSVAPVGKVMGIPTVVYDDMEHAKLQAAISLRFATYVCTGEGFFKPLGPSQVSFNAQHVLSYMAPNYFTPSPEPLKRVGLDPDTPYVFVRLVSWQAAHDRGRAQSSIQSVETLIERLSPQVRVILSSEMPLPEHLRAYASPVSIEHAHDLLAYATLCIVEAGGTMAAEAAVMGIPTICYNTFELGYYLALKQRGLIQQADDLDEAATVALDMLQHEHERQQYRQRRDQLLAESCDVVDFMMDMLNRAVAEHSDI